MLIRPIVVGHYEVFCYVLGCEQTRQGVVIDPGGDVEKILEVITELDLSVKLIINTHFHADHTFGNSALKKATGAQIVMHEADNLMLGNQDATIHFQRQGLSMSPAADLTVKDGDFLEMGQYRIQVIHTPGHSPGSICLLCGNNLFTGDSVFVGGAGRVDLPGGDFNTLMDGLAEKIAILPPSTKIWPGHDYGDTQTSTIGRELKENPFLGGEW